MRSLAFPRRRSYVLHTGSHTTNIDAYVQAHKRTLTNIVSIMILLTTSMMLGVIPDFNTLLAHLSAQQFGAHSCYDITRLSHTHTHSRVHTSNRGHTYYTLLVCVRVRIRFRLES